MRVKSEKRVYTKYATLPDFFKTQAYMLVAISVMGLLIGFFIAYFI